MTVQTPYWPLLAKVINLSAAEEGLKLGTTSECDIHFAADPAECWADGMVTAISPVAQGLARGPLRVERHSGRGIRVMVLVPSPIQGQEPRADA